MIDLDTIEKLQSASIEDRIVIIEAILRSLKTDVSTSSQPNSKAYPQRPAFGFMQSTGQILGDVVAPILPENAWDALQ
jgi:hypothetical protein